MIAFVRAHPFVSLALAGLLASIAGLLAMGQARAAGPSVRALGPDGWLVARRYLEARGAEVQLLDGLPRPDALRDGGEGSLPVLVTAHPWSRLELGEGLDTYPGYLAAGGTMVLAYGAKADALQEGLLYEALGLETASTRRASPWGPRAWRRWVDEEWALESWSAGGEAEERAVGRKPGPSQAAPVVIRAPERVPLPPEGARVLYRRSGTATPVIWTAPRGEGRLIVLPSEALANGRLGHAGNADLLEALRRELGDRWVFDELHHGLVPPEEARAPVSSLALDLFALHLALLYLFGLWALARRFGPSWRRRAVRTGSATTFLRGLGRLHHELGHHREAARLLLQRSRQLDARLPPPPAELRDLGERTLGGRDLLALARRVAAARKSGAWEESSQRS